MNTLDSNCILYSLYCDMLYKWEAGETNWLSDVRKCLNDTTFGEVWIFRDSVINMPYFVNQPTLRLLRTFTQQNGEWEGLSKSTSLTLYKEFKDATIGANI